MHSQKHSQLLLEAANRYADNISEATLEFLEGRGISEEVAGRYSLGTVFESEPGHEYQEGWLSIPYLTALGI